MDRRIRILIACTVQYFHENKMYPGILSRLGSVLASKLLIHHNIRQDTRTGEIINKRILPLLGWREGTRATSKATKREIIRLQEKWTASTPEMNIPLLPEVVQRVFWAREKEVRLEVQQDMKKRIVIVIIE
ncbi:hypothetical protein NEAUS03_1880 [Nematocida ausubeli]|nr:hypothetical protein NEAUS03_1880 [Nematocida ausubeli]